MTDKPHPFTPEQEAWLRDLETTDEPQTHSLLHRVSDGKESFCCLGRACVALGLEGEPFTLGMTYLSESNVLPAQAVAKLRLRDDIGSFKFNGPTLSDDDDVATALTELNDSGRFSFKEIAAYIRANPENVFLPPEEEKS